ncbi:MAG: hypothetical protein WC911_01745 [Thermoleophilia bacterium]
MSKEVPSQWKAFYRTAVKDLPELSRVIRSGRGCRVWGPQGCGKSVFCRVMEAAGIPGWIHDEDSNELGEGLEFRQHRVRISESAFMAELPQIREWINEIRMDSPQIHTVISIDIPAPTPRYYLKQRRKGWQVIDKAEESAIFGFGGESLYRKKTAERLMKNLNLSHGDLPGDHLVTFMDHVFWIPWVGDRPVVEWRKES